ncbi:TauD/TfdA family dioxygenase [Anabaena sp. PCC 7108]|uniref:TauD/TfdA family dioxygenase n=1 Tax=Anabaena sp. PCC 7108 TaxID=163908 RepID=UPI00034A8FB1|nr:TauD/TfdA family dioxygenase [Anabaena sp. PCC 7108]
MEDMISQSQAQEKLRLAKRRSFNPQQQEWVKTSFLNGDSSLPLIVSPAMDGVNLTNWASQHQNWMESSLSQYGGLLFRGFRIDNMDEFVQFIQATSQGELLEYTYRSTPRTQLQDKVYTSTEYPADQFISMHNENAYSTSWPMKIWFCCLQPASQGGETLVADSRKVFQRIDPAVRQKFAEKKVMYIRNYGDVDLSWEEVFQTGDRSDVEAYCRQAGIELEWNGEKLRTRQVCQAIASHPKTGDRVWFNVAHIFHISNLAEDLQKSLLSLFQPEDMPRHACYGDGSPMEVSALNQIRAAYEAETIAIKWQKGDILMLDNMLVAHGRKPFTGARQVVVGMAEPYS